MALKEIQLNISKHKLKKIMKGTNVTLTHSELGHGKTYHVEKKIYTKINRAIRNNKGLRINRDMLDLESMEHSESDDELNLEKFNDNEDIEGGKIKINLKKLVNKQGVQALEGIKKVVPKSVAKTALGEAGSAVGLVAGAYLGNPEAGKAVGQALGKSAAEGFYETDFRDKNALKDLGQNTGQAFAKEGLKTALKGQGLVNGLNPRGEMYINGNPNLKGKKSTDTIWNSNNLLKKTKKDIIGGSFLANGQAKKGRGLESNDVKYHSMRSQLIRNANLPSAYQDKAVKVGGSFRK